MLIEATDRDTRPTKRHAQSKGFRATVHNTTVFRTVIYRRSLRTIIARELASANCSSIHLSYRTILIVTTISTIHSADNKFSPEIKISRATTIVSIIYIHPNNSFLFKIFFFPFGTPCTSLEPFETAPRSLNTSVITLLPVHPRPNISEGDRFQSLSFPTPSSRNRPHSPAHPSLSSIINAAPLPSAANLRACVRACVQRASRGRKQMYLAEAYRSDK